jgi:hypothetical protein
VAQHPGLPGARTCEQQQRSEPYVTARACSGVSPRDRVGQVADQLPGRVGGQREVCLEDSGVRARLAVHIAGEAHHPRALRARRVGDLRLAVGGGPEVVDQPQVCALDRLHQLAGRLDDERGRRWRLELPVRARVTGAALDQQMAGRSATNAHKAGSPSGRSTSTHSQRISLTACLSPRGSARRPGR